MSENSRIHDIEMEDDHLGPAILFPNHEIRRMLRLAGARSDDIFFDLGCGWGQNLIVAATEFPFNIRRCIGIENDPTRLKKVRERIKRLSLSSEIEIVEASLQDVIERTIGNIGEATLIFFGLQVDIEDLDHLKSNIHKEFRLLCDFKNGIIPEIKPTAIDFPFYLYTNLENGPSSNIDWLQSVVQKERSSLHGGKPDEKELWDELSHDLHVLGLGVDDVVEVVDGYKERLDKYLKGHNPP